MNNLCNLCSTVAPSRAVLDPSRDSETRRDLDLWISGSSCEAKTELSEAESLGHPPHGTHSISQWQQCWISMDWWWLMMIDDDWWWLMMIDDDLCKEHLKENCVFFFPNNILEFPFDFSPFPGNQTTVVHSVNRASINPRWFSWANNLAILVKPICDLNCAWTVHWSCGAIQPHSSGSHNLPDMCRPLESWYADYGDSNPKLIPLNNKGLTTNGFFNHKITWARLGPFRRGRPASLKGLVILVDQEDGQTVQDDVSYCGTIEMDFESERTTPFVAFEESTKSL